MNVPARSHLSDERALTRVAASQGGFLTGKQAESIGYAAPKRSYHVQAGNWLRPRQGIFRLAAQPLPKRPDLVLWWLWSRNRREEPQGIFSHETALSLHELMDAMPSRIHITVPKGFRSSARIPKSIMLHKAELVPAEMVSTGLVSTETERIDGVPVTSAPRTLMDIALAGGLPNGDLRFAFVEAVHSGKITRAETRAAQADPKRHEVLRMLQTEER